MSGFARSRVSAVPSPGERKSLSTASSMAVALGLGLAAVSAVLFAVSVVSMPVALAGLAILWLSALPAFRYLRDGNFAKLPFYPMVGAFYAVFFAFPVFFFQFNGGAALPEVFDNPIIEQIRLEPFLLVAAALALQDAAFVVGRGLYSAVPKLRFSSAMEQSSTLPLFWLLLIVHLAFRYVDPLRQLPSVTQFLEPAGYVAFAGLILAWFRGQLRRFETFLLFAIALPLELYARVRILFLTDLLLFMIFATFVLWKAKRFKLTGWLAAGVIVVLSTYGVTNTVRDPLAPRYVNFYNAIKAYVHATLLGESEMTNIAGEPVPFRSRFGSLIQRTSHIWLFHRVYDWTPDRVRYWEGKTYAPLLTSLIPRVIYPDKPTEKAGAEFGLRYGLFGSSSSATTSANFPWITELLANFGPLGVLSGMTVFGLLLAFLDRTLNSGEAGLAETAIGVTILLPFVYPESNFSVTVGSLPLLFASLCLYFWLGSRSLHGLRWIKST